ncbi:MAG: Mur ligase domain-containing protein [Dysosmobacter sp.]
MKLRELLNGVPVASCAVDLEMEITGVSYDSRATQPGDLFVAMTGYATDGHKYIATALEKGAAAVLCQNLPEGMALISERQLPPPCAGGDRGQLVRPSRRGDDHDRRHRHLRQDHHHLFAEGYFRAGTGGQGGPYRYQSEHDRAGGHPYGPHHAGIL